MCCFVFSHNSETINFPPHTLTTHPPPPPYTLPPPQLYNTHNRCPSSLIAPALSVASKLLARRGRIGSNPWKFRQNWNNFECIWYFSCFAQFVCSYSWKVMVSPLFWPQQREWRAVKRWIRKMTNWRTGKSILSWCSLYYSYTAWYHWYGNSYTAIPDVYKHRIHTMTSILVPVVGWTPVNSLDRLWSKMRFAG